ncbi:tetratricopeptide repeat protein [Gemmatimonas sp.]|uniref:tetratricopeptide repeat protein n=1 Tax=Gemmatimonas sp. TaxID=1962908 RepID=UPI00286D4D59|nr:tetratricopeptide repeat protein [Gemmatimonas sp.]
MPTPFLSSEEYDERAHALYNEGKYDDALALLREAVALYPNAVELHVGFGYARLAREEYAWARRSFEEALVLDPEHEDALAGLGEVLLKFGQVDAGLRAFEKTVTLGYDDDVDLMLQIGRALFREGFVDTALTYFDRAVAHAEDSAEAVACVGYAQHRMGRDTDAIESLTRALDLDPQLVEARVYLGNLMYDAGDLDQALIEFEKTKPEDHWDELGIWRLVELKKSVYKLDDTDGELKPWEARLIALADETDDIDDLLEEVEQSMMEQDAEGMPEAQGQLEALGSLLTGLVNQHQGEQAEPASTDVIAAATSHRVIMRDGSVFEGTWEEIVRALRDARDAGRPLNEYMAAEARRFYGATGKQVASDAPEAFLRGGADAGMLRIDR